MSISITLHDLTIAQLTAITAVLGGDTPVQVIPTAPTLNGMVATEQEIEKAVTDTLGIAGTEQQRETTPPPPSLFDKPAEPTGDLDKANMPWDARIHASTKTQTQKGLWKKKKGVDADLVTEVEAELMGKPAVTETSAASTIPPAPPIASSPKVDFNETMMLITGAVSNGDIEMDEVIEVIAKCGGGNGGLQTLLTSPDAVPAVYTEIKGLIDG